MVIDWTEIMFMQQIKRKEGRKEGGKEGIEGGRVGKREICYLLRIVLMKYLKSVLFNKNFKNQIRLVYLKK